MGGIWKWRMLDTPSANTKQVGEVETWNEDLEIEVCDEDGAINYCPLTWKSIGFRALAGRIKALQKLKGNLQIVDLDNEYYLAAYGSYFDGATIEHIIFDEKFSPVGYYGMGKTTGVALQHTIVGKRGKFVMLAVVVDLRKPLISCIGIDNFLQRVEYDGLFVGVKDTSKKLAVCDSLRRMTCMSTTKLN
ncbi:hypothetical protein CXB51_015618 [Gossypium anomalum]|uniref:Uncharacterized protein n=1 Tax=Gossypium anomalum TaxID=47600 RepID=A0A8J5Z044_9ROSI|nr:hypothetical protein CXB51_015618 [Gossypium anomalum]